MNRAPRRRAIRGSKVLLSDRRVRGAARRKRRGSMRMGWRPGGGDYKSMHDRGLTGPFRQTGGKPLLPRPLSHSIHLRPTGQHPSNATDFGLIRSFTFNNLMFEAEGPYSFVISVENEPVSRLRFSVRARKPNLSEPK